MPNYPYEKFAAAGWRGVVRTDWRERLGSSDPLRQIETWPHQVIHPMAQWCVLRAEVDGQAVYVKHMSALSKTATHHNDLLSKLKWSLRPSRVHRTYRITQRMGAKGLQTPPVLLAARRRRGLAVEDLLITEAVEGTALRRALRLLLSLEDRKPLLELAARQIALLHEQGFIHGDLLPGNLLVSADAGDIVFLDNDRTRTCRGPLSSYHRDRNLWQMVNRLGQFHTGRDVRIFLSAYFAASGVSQKARRHRMYRVLQRLRRIPHLGEIRKSKRKRVQKRWAAKGLTPR